MSEEGAAGAVKDAPTECDHRWHSVGPQHENDGGCPACGGWHQSDTPAPTEQERLTSAHLQAFDWVATGPGRRDGEVCFCRENGEPETCGRLLREVRAHLLAALNRKDQP